MTVLRHDQASPDASLLGGKGANLARLRELGARVPPWVCLTARAPEFGLPAEDEGALLAEVDRLFPPGARLAVRSSAVAEDSARDSFAGQMETFLHVPREQVAERVRAVLASASSDRARAYREARGLAAGDAKAAVLVQLMVDARCAGVLFTANPTSGDASEAVLSAGLGLGEGVVADKVETDTYYVDLASGSVRAREIARKRTRVAFDRERGAGTVVVDVPAEEGDRPALTDAEARELTTTARQVAERLGGPQDIEWAIDQGGVVHLLQTRPITTLDREQVFDNSNIVESYPGISLPLTFSFARHAYEETFRESSRRFGVPERIIQENRHVHANLIALIDGRVYYNILHWYRLFQFVPGFEGILPAWEKALGLKRRFVRPRRDSLGARIGRLPVVTRMAARILWRFVRLRANVEAYQRTFREVREEFRQRELSFLTAYELFDAYEMLSRRLLRGYAVSLENDLFAQQACEGVSKLIAKWGLGDPMALRNDLLCGEKGMESVEPVRSALGLADLIRRTPHLSELLESGKPDREVWEGLRADAQFAGPLQGHLDRFGDRTLQELKLETPLAEDEPGFLVSMLRNFLRGGQRLEDMEQRERSIRDAAERAVAEKLRGALRRAQFGFVLRTARLAVRQREDLRLTRSRAFGMVKRVFRAMGRVLAAKGLIAEPLDVFWLTVEEVEGLLRARLVTRNLRAAVAERKGEYEAYRERTPAPRITTRGIPYLAPFEQAAPPAAEGGAVLRGIGCSPGRVRAKAKVVHAADQGIDVRGEVLIAPMTDPGWVFLMVAAGGLVVEKGSILSHTAIIGRELGIPTVVAVKDATRLIPDGALVELDGQAGTVRLA
ncbi:MAG: PEP/pyruvate-binding domain-containing protein [Planctomycetota bacterium]